jgi:hypothetical protein
MNPCVNGTPVTRLEPWLWVKHEELCCPGGPNFSKMRGVYAHMESRPEETIGVLDTFHSQGGWAVARAGLILRKRVINFFPSYRRSPGPRAAQTSAKLCGAQLVALPAGMSAVLWHQSKAKMYEMTGTGAGATGLKTGAYMFPNGLQLRESVHETAVEVWNTALPVWPTVVVVSASSGTIASGVVSGFLEHGSALFEDTPTFMIHLGYSRSHAKLRARFPGIDVQLIDEGYNYKDTARPGADAPFPCNPYYDLKAWRWMMARRPEFAGERVLFWNVGV